MKTRSMFSYFIVCALLAAFVGSAIAPDGVVYAADNSKPLLVDGLPDLVITNVVITPPEPTPGQAFTVEITIDNQGGDEYELDPPTPDEIYSDVYVSGAPTFDDQGCHPGSIYNQESPIILAEDTPITHTISFPSGLPHGNYNFHFYVDVNCSVDEEATNGEDNNDYAPINILIGYTFDDVPTTAFAWAQIESIYAAGITGGCSTIPLNYCPNSPVTRAQMAVFLMRGIEGSSYMPPAATGTVFNDVPANAFAAAWIEAFAAEGITGGCGNGNYCPLGLVTRAQMAVFLLKAKHGPGYTPPAATGTMFNDVQTNTFAAAWIEQLATEGITGGCGGGNYCPNNSVTRAQMAVFLQKTFSLPLP